MGRLCWETSRMLDHDCWTTLICTLENDHPGPHYDHAFSRGWK